jgi:hypothetical protein
MQSQPRRTKHATAIGTAMTPAPAPRTRSGAATTEVPADPGGAKASTRLAIGRPASSTSILPSRRVTSHVKSPRTNRCVTGRPAERSIHSTRLPPASYAWVARSVPDSTALTSRPSGS